MKWSVNIARVGGTTIKIHLTFLLLLVWIGISHYLSGGIDAAMEGLVFIILLFACVLLHEFGHVIAARRYGIATPDITLLPIGGVARLERMPEKPSQEIIVALAGPAVNLIIAGALFIVLGSITDMSELAHLEDPRTAMMAKLMTVNMTLLLFNLIPAFPMDGGRVLRAALASRMTHGRATRIAATVGQGLALLLGFVGLFQNPLLVFVALFIYLAASQEASVANMRERSSEFTMADVMVTDFRSLPESATLDDAIEALLRTSQRDFPVMAPDGSVHGVLTREAMIGAIRDHARHTKVGDFIERGVDVVHPYEKLDNGLLRMQQNSCPLLLVVDGGGRLIGLVTPENVSEMVMVNTAAMHTSSARNLPA